MQSLGEQQLQLGVSYWSHKGTSIHNLGQSTFAGDGCPFCSLEKGQNETCQPTATAEEAGPRRAGGTEHEYSCIHEPVGLRTVVLFKQRLFVFMY